WEAFPGHKDDYRTFLFRIEYKQTYFQVYLLSEWPVEKPNWGKWESKVLSDNFLAHGSYVFELRVNPTKRRKEDARRVGIYKDEELLKWFERKAEQSGFEILPDSLSVSPPVSDYFYKNGKSGKHNRVDFKGILAVKDKEIFKKFFDSGIGSAKAFGYGMIVLQPIK
ncbi:MAG: type I-E CRISPR-associated protein Cas6/Cse3/CasE, partial [Lentisphaerae bacterium]|nr:type I-E CRISPR-associated protein Cas6/Cse3/CasE [Lentisphaerota bacterium]